MSTVVYARTTSDSLQCVQQGHNAQEKTVVQLIANSELVRIFAVYLKYNLLKTQCLIQPYSNSSSVDRHQLLI